MTFTYRPADSASQGNLTTVTIFVTDNAPEVDDVSGSTHAGTAVTLSPMITDIDGDTVTILGASDGTSGTVTFTSTSLTYTPTSPTFTGTDSFVYAVDDGFGGVTYATATITVTNTVPEAPDDSISTHAGTPGTVTPMILDIDGDTVTVTSFSQGTHGTVGYASGVFTYTPTSPTFTGTDNFTYTVDDGHGGTATGTITVTVTNNPPSAAPDSIFTSINTPVTDFPMFSDPDGDTVTITSVPSSGTGAPAHGTVTIIDGGTGVQYTPTSGFVGTDTFTYTMSDGHGDFATGSNTITVTAAP